MNPLAKWLLISGGALTLGGPGLGVLLTVFGMMGSFKTLNESGVTDAETLATNIGYTLISTMGGFLIGALGILILIAGGIVHFSTRTSSTPLPIGNTK